MNTVLVITVYFDKHGNSHGRFVAECKKEGKEYTVIKPECLKGRVLYKGHVHELKDSKPEIGFYSSDSHYQLLNSANQTSRLTKDAISSLKTKSNERTGYSEGNKILDGFNQEQKELY